MTDRTLWIHRAACRDHEPEAFFPDQRTNPRQVRAAITICLTCPVQRECGLYARRIGANHGIWGGVLLAAERKDLP